MDPSVFCAPFVYCLSLYCALRTALLSSDRWGALLNTSCGLPGDFRAAPSTCTYHVGLFVYYLFTRPAREDTTKDPSLLIQSKLRRSLDIIIIIIIIVSGNE